MTNLDIDLVRWISAYNGYARLGNSPLALASVIEPASEEFRRTGRVPEWCGIDLLRGWAFYLLRADRLGGGYGHCDEQILAVIAAYEAHPASEGVPGGTARSDATPGVEGDRRADP